MSLCSSHVTLLVENQKENVFLFIERELKRETIRA